MSQVEDTKTTEQIVDEWAKEGYFHWKHQIGGVQMVFYMQDKPGSSWLHAQEGTLDFAFNFRNMIKQSQAQAAKKKEEEIPSTDAVERKEEVKTAE